MTRAKRIWMPIYIRKYIWIIYIFNIYYLGNYFDGDETEAKLQAAVQSLPPKQRQVFNMKYFDEMKYEAISEILGTTVGGLKASYHLAVEKIEKFLNGDY